MSEPRQLFDKPMDVLREAFVLGRFAEQAVFGRADVEAWFAKQRYAERPQEKTWVRFLGRGSVQPWADRDFFDLRTHATSLGVLNEQLGSLGDADAYGPIYDRLAFASSGLDLKRTLYDGDAGMLYVEDHIHGPMFVVREEWGKGGGVTISRVRSRSENPGARTILGVVFAEWQRGRPMWRSARASLCRAFESEIADERAKAEHDFDTAIAVSADGTKIVHADWVVVVPVAKDAVDWFRVRCVRSLPVWPASAFTGEKIRRTNHMLRSEFPKSDEMWGFNYPGEVPTFAQAVKAGYGVARRDTNEFVRSRQIYCEMHLSSGTQRLFFTSAEYCPSPLPNGSVEMKV